MSSHVYHEIYIHLNWHTKADYPALKDATVARLEAHDTDEAPANKPG